MALALPVHPSILVSGIVLSLPSCPCEDTGRCYAALNPNYLSLNSQPNASQRSHLAVLFSPILEQGLHFSAISDQDLCIRRWHLEFEIDALHLYLNARPKLLNRRYGVFRRGPLLLGQVIEETSVILEHGIRG